GALALRAPYAVVARGVLVANARIDDHDLEVLGDGDRLVGERPGVEIERPAIAREARGHLIHDADRRPDEIVFGALAEAGDADVVDAQREELAEAPKERDLERGARR